MYRVLMKCCFRQQIQYKWNLLFQIIGDWLAVYIKICIWQAILNAGGIKNISFNTLVSYSVIAAMVSGLLRSRIAEELADRLSHRGQTSIMQRSHSVAAKNRYT